MTFSKPFSGTYSTGDISEWYSYWYKGVFYEKFHHGVDFYKGGSAPIFSITQGKVIEADFSSSLGNYVMLQHSDSYGNLIDRYSVYAHMKNSALVTKGQYISQSSALGYEGRTGLATGDHLHLAISTSKKLSAENYIQLGSFQSEQIYGDQSRTVPNGTEQRDDLIIGMGGNDTIYGGLGNDTVEYQDRLEDIWFFRASTTATFTFFYEGQELFHNVLHDVENIADNGGRHTIDITDAPQNVLMAGRTNYSTKYLLPTDPGYNSCFVDGGG